MRNNDSNTHSPDDKEHAVDTDGFSSAAIDDESSSSLEPDALTVGIEESVVATQRLAFLKNCKTRRQHGCKGGREMCGERERERERERELKI